MKFKLTKVFSTATLALALMLTPIDSGAQDFKNNGAGSYKAGTAGTGVIKMRGTAAAGVNGEFTSDDGNELGRDLNNRIEGTVDWTKSTDQTIQARWYTNLNLTGTTKSIPDAVYVFGAYDPSLATGIRTYAGTFYYDGIDQSIFPESSGGAGGGGQHFNLNIAGQDLTGAATAGIKTVTVDSVHVLHSLVVDANSTIRIYNSGAVRTGITGGGGPGSTVAGPVVIGYDNTSDPTVGGFVTGNEDITFSNTVGVDYDNSSLIVYGTGNAIFDGDVTVGNPTTNPALVEVTDNVTGYADFNANFSLAGNNSTVRVGLNAEMQVTGAFTDAGDGTNLTFDTGSTVLYDGADGQSVVRTIATNQYANLIVDGGGTKSVTGGDAYIAETMGLGTRNTTTPTKLTLGDTDLNAVIMTNGLASYHDAAAGNVSEVIGKMRRVNDGTNSLVAADTYVMNNAETQISFGTLTNTGEYFQMDVRPTEVPSAGTPPDSYTQFLEAPSDPNDEVNRLIVVDQSDLAGSAATIDYLKVGYQAAEYGGNATREQQTRLIEGDGQYLDGSGFSRKEKLHMAEGPSARQASGSNTWGFVELNSSDGSGTAITMVDAANTRTPAGNFQKLGQGSAVVITSEDNYLITVRGGRWSDPLTWDESRVPYTVEHAIVRHVVYTGHEADPLSIGYPYAGDESDATTNGTHGTRQIAGTDAYLLCKSVELTETTYPGADPSNTAIVILNDDTDQPANMVYVFGQTTQVGDGSEGMTLDNTTIPAGDFSLGAVNANLQGIWVNAEAGGRVPAMRAARIENNGMVVNNSVIEIGD